MPNIIHQTIFFKASPHEVYQALMDTTKHAEFTGGEARISDQVNGEIMAYDGYITGKNIELVPDQKIVQDWRAVDWPEGIFSRVTFEFTPIPGGASSSPTTNCRQAPKRSSPRAGSRIIGNP
jgi:uncharacterized protein YndB with AHSA1/START domain